jgi:hypothetical protein
VTPQRADVGVEGDRLLVDPRGPLPEARQQALAPRRSSIQQRTVLLYDNGKCHPEFGGYHVLFDELGRRLEAEGARVVRESFSDPVSPILWAAKLTEVVADINGRHAPEAVVIAVGDAGVSNATVRLAIELEAAGVPTVSLYTGLGIQVARAVAAARAEALPLLVVDQPASAAASEMESEARGLLVSAIGALTSQPVQPPAITDADAAARGVLPVQNSLGTIPEYDVTRLHEALCRANLGDGLPILLPNEESVGRLVAASGGDANEVLIEAVEPMGAPLTLRVLAANAALTGCQPEQMPVLRAACEAMADERYRLAMANTTTHGSGNLVFVSGPGVRTAGINAGAGCLGPGSINRANLAIGRALTQVGINVGRAIIGSGDLVILGSPAKISYCFGEAEGSPWPSLASDVLGPGATTVTVARCEGPHNVLDTSSNNPEMLLTSFALAMASGASNNAFAPAECFVIMNPEHAGLVARAGWTKADVQAFLFERARVPRANTVGRAIRPTWPPSFSDLDPVPVVEKPEEIFVVVSGGLGGMQSAVALPWGYCRAVTVAVREAQSSLGMASPSSTTVASPL